MKTLSSYLAKPQVWVSLVVVAGLVAAQFGTLGAYPLPSCDEVGYADAAYTWVTAGHPGWSIFPEGDKYGRDVTVVHHGRTYLLGLGAMLLAFGRTLWATRLYSLSGGLLAVALTFLVGQRLYNRQVGLLAAAVFLTSFKFFWTSHLGRPEIWATVSVLLTFYLLLRSLDANPSRRLLFSTGLAAVWMLDIHFNTLAFLAAALVIAAWRFGWQQRQWQSLFVLGTGVGLGLIGWVAVHLWPSPALAWQQLTGFSVTYIGGEQGNSGFGLLTNFTSIGTFLKTALVDIAWPVSLIELGLAALGLTLALTRRSQTDALWLITIIVSGTAFAVAFSQRFATYSVLWTPFLIMGGIAAMDYWLKRWQPGNAKLVTWLVAGLAGFICLVQVGADDWLTYKFSANNFKLMEAQLSEAIPQGARVMGDDNWWWALEPGRVFISDQYLLSEDPNQGNNNPQVAGEVWVGALMQRLHPDYVLYDGAINCGSDHGQGWVELGDYLTKHCALINQLAGTWANDPAMKTDLLGQTTFIYTCQFATTTQGRGTSKIGQNPAVQRAPF